MAIWEGVLTPIAQSYRIWLRYFPELFWDEVTLRHPYITVKVLDPQIAPDARGTGELTPHVYRYRHPPHTPALCAWDPQEENWNPSMYIADDIIPATIRWLMFFEDWLDTGTWRGGGRHPDPDSAAATTPSSTPSSAASSIDPIAFNELGLRMGLHTSSLAIGRARYGAFPSAMDFSDRLFRPVLQVSRREHNQANLLASEGLPAQP